MVSLFFALVAHLFFSLDFPPPFGRPFPPLYFLFLSPKTTPTRFFRLILRVFYDFDSRGFVNAPPLFFPLRLGFSDFSTVFLLIFVFSMFTFHAWTNPLEHPVVKVEITPSLPTGSSLPNPFLLVGYFLFFF